MLYVILILLAVPLGIVLLAERPGNKERDKDKEILRRLNSRRKIKKGRI